MQRRVATAMLCAAIALSTCGERSSAPLTSPASSEIWRPFSDDSPWNSPLPDDVILRADSDELIRDLGDGGHIYINIQEWSIPVYYVDRENTPYVTVTNNRPGIFGQGFGDETRVPIPDGAAASLPRGGDEHLAIIDRKAGVEWGMWWAHHDDERGWSTGLGAQTDITGDGVSLPWNECEREFDCHRARASGFPLIAGLMRPEHFEAGVINHALVMAGPKVLPEWYISPASTAQAKMKHTRQDDNGLPMGALIRLSPDFDIEAAPLSDEGKIIARALQTYGAYMGDFAGANVIYADGSPDALLYWEGRLDNEEISALFTGAFIAGNFEVVDTGQWRKGQNIGERKP